MTHRTQGGFDTTALRGPLPRTGQRPGGSRLPLLIALGVLALVVVVVGAVAARQGTGVLTALADPVLLGALGLGAVLAALVGLLLALLVRSGGRRSRRLAAFAAANGLTYHPRHPQPADLPETGLFGRVRRGGQAGWISDVVVDARGRHVEYGQAAVRRGPSRGSSAEWWGYVAVRTPVPMPHVAVLRRGRLGRPAAPFASLRQLAQDVPSVPGLDPRFTVLCPAGHERDVAAVVSPELFDRWATLGLEVEILDRWVVLFRRGRLVTLDPDRWQELATMTTALDARLTAWEAPRVPGRPRPQAS
ncbi:hypothetical protein [Oceanitalea stevensii]|uniref:DUF3137 domain-containing protein n=1 Tax=Oceanitalea stevensii TaxID=2763072 RepID=A0ABR8Z2T4_9MICO|nr:hypothetical protein [Oceanitalea stevensii]MBD8062647.1 hypothetical protein [Oceanitalea stevensii]